MNGAFIGAGIAKGAAQVADWERNREMRDLQRKEAQQRVKMNDQAMAQNEQVSAEQLKQLQMQTQQLAQQQFRSDTYNALRLYESDGDPRHLNGFLQQAKQSPVAGNMFANIARVDRLTSSDAELVKQLGVQDVDGLVKDPNLAKQFVVATFANGEKGLVDMEKMYAGTGFANQLASEQAELMNTRSLAISRLRTGERADRLSSMERVAKQMSEELGIPMWQAYERLKGGTTKQQGSELERLAQQIQEQNPDMDYLDAYEQAVNMRTSGSETERAARTESEQTGEDYNTVLQRKIKEKNAPGSVKEADAANTATAELQDAFGGKYYETDFSDPNARRLAQPYIRTIEKTTGAKFSEEDKRQFRLARQLVGLGERAGTAITPEETGLIDSMLSNVQSYISDEVSDGKAGVAAYESFRNVVRNALFGSALTGAEIDAFNKAAGTLGQQQGPVLSKFMEQLKVVRDNLSGVAQMNDEVLSHYYLGADQDKVSDIIYAIDERINRLNKLSKNKNAPIPQASAVPVAPKTPEQKREVLDAIFKKGNQ